jgi:hypothetical protein
MTGNNYQAHRIRLRYWGALCRNTKGRGWTGWVTDFYPQEKIRHRRELLESGVKLLGPYDTRDAALAAVRQEMIRPAGENRGRQ